MRSPRCVAVAAMGILLLAGCTQSPSVGPATAAASTAAQPAPASKARAADPACTAKDVEGSLGVNETNDAYVTSLQILVKNTGTRTCTINGYGDVEFYTGGDGSALGINQTQAPTPAPSLVQVPPGKSASMTLSWKNNAGGKYDPECGAFIGFVGVTLPDDAKSFEIDGDLGQSCDNHRVDVSAFS